jgi:hypothetical protein
VLPTGVIIVFEDVGGLLTLEPLRQLGLPLAGAPGVRGRDQPEGGDIVGILLALANPDRHVGRRREQLWQSIRDHGAGPSVDPAAISPMLCREGLAAGADDAHVQAAACVLVDVARAWCSACLFARSVALKSAGIPAIACFAAIAFGLIIVLGVVVASNRPIAAGWRGIKSRRWDDGCGCGDRGVQCRRRLLVEQVCNRWCIERCILVNLFDIRIIYAVTFI